MRTLNLEEYYKLKAYHCDKGKHKYRSNHFGISWCTICGALSNKDFPTVEEDDKLLIRLR